MPEYVELVSSCKLAQHWFNSVKGNSNLLLKDIHIDASKAEQESSKAHVLAKAGLPYPLAADSKVKRGPRFAQEPVYPPVNVPIVDAAFRLTGVTFNPRNVLLQFHSSSSDVSIAGEWWMQVQMLTHTVVQVYDSSQWRGSISKVNKKDRGFKIGMALDFGDYVMAFLTIDNLFRTFYSRTRETLPAPLLDIYFDFVPALNMIIDWAEDRADSDRSGLASDIIRKAAGIFVGIGVYTISEVMHRAGLLPLLTERELFDDPSRFARFVESFYCHAARAHTDVWSLVKPFLRGKFFISVRNKDRLAYTKWLAVHGKENVLVPKRLQAQYQDLMLWFSSARNEAVPRQRNPESGFFDLVEPTFLQVALKKDHNLGDLIFGKDTWVAQGGKLWVDNPLVAYFNRRSIAVARPNYLHPSVTSYQPFFLPINSLRKSWLETTLYYTSDKPFWCVVPNLPSNTYPAGFSSTTSKGKGKGKKTAKEPPQVTPAPREEKKKQLFDYIVNYSIDYAVGPLDYCGIAHVRHNRIILCRNDPQVSEYICDRLEQGIRRRQHLQPGKQKTANPKAFKRKRAEDELDENRNGDNEDDSASGKMKRRRISVDKRLVLGSLLQDQELGKRHRSAVKSDQEIDGCTVADAELTCEMIATDN